jgi:hypothetical protein
MSGIPVMHCVTQNAKQPFNGLLMQPSLNFWSPAHHIGNLIPVPKVKKVKEQLYFQAFSSSFEVFTLLGCSMVLNGSCFQHFGTTYWFQTTITN